MRIPPRAASFKDRAGPATARIESGIRRSAVAVTAAR